ncbi:MAG: type II toxin-antitoxin system VapC family toxin [Janthinobacterium lividum]
MTAASVLDASALLCVIFAELGADRVIDRLDGALIGAVNYSEVVAKIIERQADADRLFAMLADLKMTIVPFDAAQAEAAGRLRLTTRSAGLSLGDRACLALAMSVKGCAITTDRAWDKVASAVGVEIEFAR